VLVLPNPFWIDEGVEELHRDLNSPVTPQGLDQRSKMEEIVPKVMHWRGSDAKQFKRR